MGDLDDMFDELEPEVITPAPMPTPAPKGEPQVDTVGVPFYLGSTTDSYGTGNPYVVALAIGSTPCFGTYEQGHPTCGVCPLSGSCRAQVYSLLGQIGATLDAHDLGARTVRVDVETTGTPTATSDDDLDAIVKELNTTARMPPVAAPTAPRAAAPPPVASAAPSVWADAGIEIPARADAKCYLCKGDIRKREMILFVPTKGMRHKACPSATGKP